MTHSRESGLDPAAPSKLSQISFEARVPVSNSPAFPTTGPDGAGDTPTGGLEFQEGGTVEPWTHWPEPLQLRPESQVPQLPLQPSEPQTFPEQLDEQPPPTVTESVSLLLP